MPAMVTFTPARLTGSELFDSVALVDERDKFSPLMVKIPPRATGVVDVPPLPVEADCTVVFLKRCGGVPPLPGLAHGLKGKRNIRIPDKNNMRNHTDHDKVNSVIAHKDRVIPLDEVGQRVWDLLAAPAAVNHLSPEASGAYQGDERQMTADLLVLRKKLSADGIPVL